MSVDDLRHIDDVVELVRGTDRVSDITRGFRALDNLEDGLSATQRIDRFLDALRTNALRPNSPFAQFADVHNLADLGRHIDNMPEFAGILRHADDAPGVVRHADDVQPQAGRTLRTAEGLDTVAEANRRTRGWFSRWFNSAPTRKQMLIWAVAPGALLYGAAWIDEASGGEISYQAMRWAVDRIVDGWEAATENMTPEQIRQYMAETLHNLENWASILAVNPVTNAMRNAFVAGAIASEPENPTAGVDAAIAFQFRNPAMLVAKNSIRAMVFARVYEDISQEERDRMLAQGLVDDIIKGAEVCPALSDTSLGPEGRPTAVTQADIERVLREHPLLASNLPANLKRGLIQIFPNLREILERPGLADQYIAENAPNQPPGQPPQAGPQQPGRQFTLAEVQDFLTLNVDTLPDEQVSNVFNNIATPLGERLNVDSWTLWFIKIGIQVTDFLGIGSNWLKKMAIQEVQSFARTAETQGGDLLNLINRPGNVPGLVPGVNPEQPAPVSP